MFRGSPVHNRPDFDIADYAARVWQEAAKEKFPGSRFVHDFDEVRHESHQPPVRPVLYVGNDGQCHGLYQRVFTAR